MRKQIDAAVATSTGRQILLSLTLLAAVVTSLVAAPGPDGLMGALLAALMLAIAASDFRRYIIPDELTAAAAALARPRRARARRYQAGGGRRRLAWPDHPVRRGRTGDAVGARGLLPDRRDPKASAQGDRLPALRAVPGAGDLARLALGSAGGLVFLVLRRGSRTPTVPGSAPIPAPAFARGRSRRASSWW
jgi:hypothetical protein